RSKNPTQFHGIGKFDINTGEPKISSVNFSSCFGETMCSFAENDGRICCVTAAMAEGTGLCEFAKKFPKRFFDVGIAEQHAVTFSGGLARNGMVPVFAVYSTFLQRAYDQLIHDVAMQKLKVIFGIDRAGFVGEDGESHQGVFDTAFLNSVVGLTVFAPSFYTELEAMLYEGIYKTEGAVAIRYPRGTERYMPKDYSYSHSSYSVFGDRQAESCIVTYGRLFSECYSAYEKLDNTFIIKLNKIKPIEEKVFEELDNCKNIYFYEEGIRSGGVGEVFASMLAEKNIKACFKLIAINDEFIKQASVDSQLKHYKMDCSSIIEEVSNAQSKKDEA
ncbi:MAG: transketolase C-terminal domain-containing protein, partial [Eubacterium sp.]